jgi:hypothetical protein
MNEEGKGESPSAARRREGRGRGREEKQTHTYTLILSSSDTLHSPPSLHPTHPPSHHESYPPSTSVILFSIHVHAGCSSRISEEEWRGVAEGENGREGERGVMIAETCISFLYS